MADNSKITTITHGKSGASVQIHAFGATVISYKTGGGGADNDERLFVSRDAKLDGSKAIRGGIPLVFPHFGPCPAPSTMPQHGFARVNEWTLVKKHDSDAAVASDDVAATATYTLSLKDVTAGRGENNPWSTQQAALDGTDCLLTYEVELTEKQLTTTLIIQNTGSSSFNFQALLHTYLKVHDRAAQDKSKTFVKGLGGYAITDKVTGDSGHVQSYDEPVSITGEVDRVYIHPDQHPTVHADVNVGGGTGSSHVRLEAAGQVDENVSPVSCVVWNPGADKAAAMSDFGNDQYQDMICVEPGLLGHQPLLEPGKEARLSQTLIPM